MDVQKIYEGWAQEIFKEPHIAPFDNWHNNTEVLILQQKAYAAALEDRLEDVAVKFSAWKYTDDYKKWLDTDDGLSAFQYFLNNILWKVR